MSLARESAQLYSYGCYEFLRSGLLLTVFAFLRERDDTLLHDTLLLRYHDPIYKTSGDRR